MSNSQTDAMTTAVKTLEQRAREAAEANVTESKPINKRFYAVGWRDGYLAAAKEAEQEIAALSKVVALADALAGGFERAVASRNPVSGMQVSPSGDFISCAQLPSAIKRMGWWAREIRAAGDGRRLTQTTPEVERLRARVAELEGMVPRWVLENESALLNEQGWSVSETDKLGNGPRLWLMVPPIPLQNNNNAHKQGA